MHTWKRRVSRAIAVAAAAALGTLALVVFSTAPAEAVRPPGIPDAATAQTELDALTVAPEANNDSYDRDLFPHWSSVGDGCTARQFVLKRDGEDVQLGDDCQPDSGNWQSDFDDSWTTDVSNASIDHVVALGEAWGSGASEWTTDEREAFANDIESPQLWVATVSINGQKGALDPAEWMPPNESVRCDYVKAWTHVKYLYSLTVDEAEKDAIQGYLTEYCGSDGGDPGDPTDPEDPGDNDCTGSDSPAATITEGSAIESAIALDCADTASATSTVTVDITHPYSGDIAVDLVAPDGTAYAVQESGSGSGDFGTRDYTVDLSSEAESGTWTLQVTDTYEGGSTGTLNSWSLNI